MLEGQQYAFSWHNSRDIIHHECTFDCRSIFKWHSSMLSNNYSHPSTDISLFTENGWTVVGKGFKLYFVIKMFYDCRWKLLLLEQKLLY